MDVGLAHTLITLFLHDPPDKALDIRGHEARTKRYLSAVTGEDLSRDGIKGTAQAADQQAAIAERVPMPTPGPDYRRAVGPKEGGHFITFHSVSATQRDIRAGNLDESRLTAILHQLVQDDDGMEQRFLTLWRLLPERLVQEFGDDWRHLPADTRLPDHTLWHHADIATGIEAARSGIGGPAFLSFSIGPVQSFIAAARQLRDLWSGSTLLSWLVFQAMEPILEAYGPTALVFPALRGNVLMDRWLREKNVRIPEPSDPSVTGLPNRFLALVPYGRDGETGRVLAKACEKAVRDAWIRVADAVRNGLGADLNASFSEWDKRWTEQVETLPEVSWVLVPERELDDALCGRLAGGKFGTVWKGSQAIRDMASAIPITDRPGYAQDQAGRWQAQIETVARIAEAARLRRPVPVLDGSAGHRPGKCSILGTHDQMGPVGFNDQALFWDRFWLKDQQIAKDGVRLRKGERLCAISLVKRFAVPLFLEKEMGLNRRTLARFPDTATVAARIWLNNAEIDPQMVRDRYRDWSGQWLHGGSDDTSDTDSTCPPEFKQEIRDAAKRLGIAPPAYYALLMADGDNMGDWLAGRKAPNLDEVMHPALVTYYQGLKLSQVDAGLAAKRPVGPALHAAISDALNRFAATLVPRIVDDHHGILVYAGGDDVLALLPVEAALTCAKALRDAFCSADVMGEKAGLSVGVVVVHHKEDLRGALETARQAEKAAKNGGRDQLCLAVMRRSGEQVARTLPWDLVPRLDALRHDFSGDASDRWAYRLREEAPTLNALPSEAIKAEIGRLLRRTADHTNASEENIVGFFDRYAQWRKKQEEKAMERDPSRKPTDIRLADDAAILFQSAAFLARGRDR